MVPSEMEEVKIQKADLAARKELKTISIEVEKE